MLRICKLIFAICIVILAGCSCKKEKTDNFYIINVLDKDLYKDCHIRGSINIPFEELEKEIVKFNKDVIIVLYCSNYKCAASKFGAQMLKEQGFRNVYAYEAGIAEWYQKGLPVDGECKMPYLKDSNEKIEDESDGIPVITTDELKEKLTKKLAV